MLRLAERLKDQLRVIEIEESDDAVNPFDHMAEEDIEEAAQPFHLLDDDNVDDEDIDIL